MKTVFEVNLQLFHGQGQTLLLFVIRDHIEEDTPFESLKKKLLTEMVTACARSSFACARSSFAAGF
jgi:hypothetical protein